MGLTGEWGGRTAAGANDSDDASGEGVLHRLARAENPPHGKRVHDGQRQLGIDIFRDREEAHHADVESLLLVPQLLEELPPVHHRPDDERLTPSGLPNRFLVLPELIANRHADELGAVGVEPLLHQQLDLAEIDGGEVDGDLFELGHFKWLPGKVSPSIRMVYGCYAECIGLSIFLARREKAERDDLAPLPC